MNEKRVFGYLVYHGYDSGAVPLKKWPRTPAWNCSPTGTPAKSKGERWQTLGS